MITTAEVRAVALAGTVIHADRNGYHLRIDAVPAWVSGQCGEPFLEEREVRGIQRLLTGLDRQALRLASAA